MPLISIITTCKGRLSHLRETLPKFVRTGAEVVVVDYDCPDHTGDWVRANHPGVTVVDVVERPGFNAADARNRGAAVATGEWLFFADADVIVDPAVWPEVAPRLAPGCFLLAAEPRPYDLWGALVVSRTWFDAVGGYDEAIEGWGGEDVDIYERLIIRGAQAAALPGGLLGTIAHGDDARLRFHAIGDKKLITTINGLYRIVKNDLARLGEWLELAARRRLYASIRDALVGGASVRAIEVPVHPRALPHFDVHVTLSYEFKPQDPADP